LAIKDFTVYQTRYLFGRRVTEKNYQGDWNKDFIAKHLQIDQQETNFTAIGNCRDHMHGTPLPAECFFRD